MKLFSAAELNGSVVVPEDFETIQKNSGAIKINGTAGYRSKFGAQTGTIHPAWLFADCDGSIETQGPAGGVSQSVASTSESGIVGPDAQIRFGKTADPDDVTKVCYVMRREQTDETTLKRTELSFSPTFTPIPLGVPCWIGFAIRIPTAWKVASASDETMVFQIHETLDGGDDTQPAPIGLIVKGQGMLMWVRSNPNAVTLSAATTYTEVWTEASYPGDVWQFFAVRIVSHWNNSFNPKLEVWRRISGITTKIVNYIGPNAYNNTARDYVKSGLYYYDEEWSGGLTERQMHHKGIYQWLNQKELNQEVILNMLETI